MISVRDTREGVWVILLGLSLYVECSLHISISLILVLSNTSQLSIAIRPRCYSRWSPWMRLRGGGTYQSRWSPWMRLRGGGHTKVDEVLGWDSGGGEIPKSMKSLDETQGGGGTYQSRWSPWMRLRGGGHTKVDEVLREQVGQHLHQQQEVCVLFLLRVRGQHLLCNKRHITNTS